VREGDNSGAGRHGADASPARALMGLALIRAGRQPGTAARVQSAPPSAATLLAVSLCGLLVVVGSGGHDSESLHVGARRPRDVEDAELSLQENAGVLRAGLRTMITRLALAAPPVPPCADVPRVWGPSVLCRFHQPQILRQRGGSDHRAVSPHRGQQRVPPASAASARHDEMRRDGGGRGERMDARGDQAGDRKLRLEVGDKCVSILRELGGVADLPRLAERWAALYPRSMVSRDGQVLPVLVACHAHVNERPRASLCVRC